MISSDFCHWGRRFRFTPFSGLGEKIAAALTLALALTLILTLT